MPMSFELPDLTELEDDGAGSVAADEKAVADAAAAAVEEGDEQESPRSADGAEEADSEAAEDTLLEEPGVAAIGEERSRRESSVVATAPLTIASIAYLQRYAEARDRYAGAMFEWRKLKAAAKAAEERWKEAEDALYDMQGESGDFEPEIVGLSCETVSASEAPASESPAGDSATAICSSEAWRAESVLALSLKTAIVDKLIEAGYDTLGKLEDLRADVHAGGLKSVKGIGQTKADAIEEAILCWLSEHRDKEAFYRLKKPTANDCEITPEMAALLEEAKAAAKVAVLDDDWSIRERARDIYYSQGEFAGVSGDEALDPTIECGRHWESGDQAYGRGDDLIHCPYVSGVERDDWLRGWMSAKLTNEEDWPGPGTGSKGTI